MFFEPCNCSAVDFLKVRFALVSESECACFAGVPDFLVCCPCVVKNGSVDVLVLFVVGEEVEDVVDVRANVPVVEVFVKDRVLYCWWKWSE